MNAVEDIDSMMIDRSKFMANGAKYFELFEKHIPRGISGNVLIMSVGNLDCLDKIMSLNKNAKYVIVENSRIIKCLSKLFDRALDIKAIENDGLNLYNIIKELDMKFDCIIMNPPYKGKLHLDILTEAIKQLKDDGICVNLSPVRWLQDVIGHISSKTQFNKYKDKVSIHTKDINVISAKTACELFCGGASADLGIYVCDKNVHKIPDIKNHYADFILEKVVFKVVNGNNISKHITKEISSKFFVTIPESHGHIGAKDWCDIISPIKKFGREKSNGTHAYYVLFNTDQEAENFRLFLMSDFARFINLYVKMNMSNRPNCLPWLGDAINPRTGLKGYEGEWTDDDLYKFFNITPEEQKVIEETMEKYK